MSIRDSAEWTRGDTAQRAWADILARNGKCVLPAYAFENVDSRTKAPVMLTRRGLLVTPDIVSFGHGQESRWDEIKAKSTPTWRRMPPGPRWEHGFDYSLVAEYQRVQARSGLPIFIVVREERSPADSAAESPLTGPALWLLIPLSRAVRVGRHERRWPKKNGNENDRGRGGLGGLLWPRSAMYVSMMPGARPATR